MENAGTWVSPLSKEERGIENPRAGSENTIFNGEEEKKRRRSEAMGNRKKQNALLLFSLSDSLSLSLSLLRLRLEVILKNPRYHLLNLVAFKCIWAQLL